MMPLFSFMEILTNKLNNSNVPVGNTRASDLNVAGVQGAGKEGAGGSTASD
jgi:hypothetical protein